MGNTDIFDRIANTYDTAAIKYAFYLMQEVRGFQSMKETIHLWILGQTQLIIAVIILSR